MTRPGRVTAVTQAAAAAIALLALVAAPPVLLVRFVGNPWPAEGIDLAAPLTDNAIIGLLAVVVWVLWAQVAWCFLAETTAALTRDQISPPTRFTFAIQRQVARRLVSILVVATVAAPVIAAAAPGWATAGPGPTVTPAPRAATADPAATGTPTSHGATAGTVTTTYGAAPARANVATHAPIAPDPATDLETGRSPGTTSPSWQSQSAPAATPGLPHATRNKGTSGASGTPFTAADATGRPPAPATTSVTVMRLDSLWSIAERVLGEGERWSEIAALNEGRTMTDGTVFASANHIRPGWRLAIPSAADSAQDAATGEHLSAGHVVVRPGDTLTELAQEHLGDAAAARQIFLASVDITQPDGRHLTDPDLIDVGWTLDLGSNLDPFNGQGNPPDREPDNEADTEATTPNENTDSGQPGAPDDRPGAPDPSAPPGDQAGPTPPADTRLDLGSDSQPGAAGPSSTTGPLATPSPTTSLAPRQTPDAVPDEDATEPSPAAEGDQGRASPTEPAAESPAGTPAEPPGQPWMLLGFTGAGSVLAAGLLLALRTRRRDQARSRPPGHAFPGLGPDLVQVEKSTWVHHDAAETSHHLDVLLRQLAAAVAHHGGAMPHLAAVEVDADHSVTMHLSSPAELPTPWAPVNDAGTAWRVPADAGAETDNRSVLDVVDPPYPLLVGVGQSETGAVWLLNLEELADVLVTGHPGRATDFVRYVVTEAALNPWADQARISCLGLEHAMADVEDSRIETHPLSQAPAVIANAIEHAGTTTRRAEDHDVDPSTARARQIDLDTWPALLLCLDTAGTEPTDDEPSRTPRDGRPHGTAHDSTMPPDTQLDSAADQQPTAATTHLRAYLHAARGTTATALVCLHPGANVAAAGKASSQDGQDDEPAIIVHVETDGTLQVPAFGLHLRANQLTEQDSVGCAALLAAIDQARPETVAWDDTADDGWEQYADRAGAVRPAHTRPRESPLVSDEAVSLLPGPDETYEHHAAITSDDLAVLAPTTSTVLEHEVRVSDPHLDQDVTDWFDPSCHRPRLTLLGPVSLKAYGKALAKRKPYFTEMVAYLVSHRRHGVRPSDLADTFDIDVRKARIYVNTIRDWLGPVHESTPPATSGSASVPIELYLPHADKAPSARISGVPVYQIDGRLLVDYELFRRLRVRGQARGADGIGDLETALALVTGRPYDNLRPGGWSWLLDGERDDHYASHAVADVALIVTAACLTDADVTGARGAAEKGLLAAPDENATRISLARVLAAEGNPALANQMLKDSVFDRDDDGRGPVELTARDDAAISRWHAAG